MDTLTNRLLTASRETLRMLQENRLLLKLMTDEAAVQATLFNSQHRSVRSSTLSAPTALLHLNILKITYFLIKMKPRVQMKICHVGVE